MPVRSIQTFFGSEAKSFPVRVDQKTRQASVIDVVKMVTRKRERYASSILKNYLVDTEFTELRINDQGDKSPVADASTLIEIIWDLPGNIDKAHRIECEQYIERILEEGGEEEHSGGEEKEAYWMEISTETKEGKEGKEQEEMTLVPEEDIEDIVPYNPVRSLGLMNLKAEDFKDCRRKNNLICVYDAIRDFRGLKDPKRAREIFDRITSKIPPQSCGLNFNGESDGSEDERKKLLKREFPSMEWHKFPTDVMTKSGRPRMSSNEIPCVNFTDLQKILSQVPGREAKALRNEQAEIASRATVGDGALQEVMEERRTDLSKREREFLADGIECLDEQSSSKRQKLAEDPHQRSRRLEREDIAFLTDIREREMKLVAGAFDLYSRLGPLDERDRIFLKDYARNSMSHLGLSGGNLLTSAQGPDPGRLREISIHLVASELGLQCQGKEGQIGRKIVQLWRQKHGHGPEVSPPKRDTMFRGKPFKENAYFQEDYDVVERAIRETLACS